MKQKRLNGHFDQSSCLKPSRVHNYMEFLAARGFGPNTGETGESSQKYGLHYFDKPSDYVEEEEDEVGIEEDELKSCPSDCCDRDCECDDCVRCTGEGPEGSEDSYKYVVAAS